MTQLSPTGWAGHRKTTVTAVQTRVAEVKEVRAVMEQNKTNNGGIWKEMDLSSAVFANDSRDPFLVMTHVSLRNPYMIYFLYLIWFISTWCDDKYSPNSCMWQAPHTHAATNKHSFTLSTTYYLPYLKVHQQTRQQVTTVGHSPSLARDFTKTW